MVAVMPTLERFGGTPVLRREAVARTHCQTQVAILKSTVAWLLHHDSFFGLFPWMSS